MKFNSYIFKDVILPVALVLALCVVCYKVIKPTIITDDEMDKIRRTYRDIQELTIELKVISSLNQQFLEEEKLMSQDELIENEHIYTDLLNRTKLSEEGYYLEDESDFIIQEGNYNLWI